MHDWLEFFFGSSSTNVYVQMPNICQLRGYSTVNLHEGSLSSLNHSIYSEAQTPARSLALTGAYEAR